MLTTLKRMALLLQAIRLLCTFAKRSLFYGKMVCSSKPKWLTVANIFGLL